MTVLIILAHPEQGSFNHAIAETAAATLKERGYECTVHDLYAEGFDPILPGREIPRDGTVSPDVEIHCREVAQARGLIFIHPNWWGQPPALLKGWIDRVIRPGLAYEFLEGDGGEGIPRGLLAGKTGLVFNTSNTSAERERDFFGDPLELIWKKCIFEFCGVSPSYRAMFSTVVTSTSEERRRWLNEVREAVEQYFPSI